MKGHQTLILDLKNKTGNPIKQVNRSLDSHLGYQNKIKNPIKQANAKEKGKIRVKDRSKEHKVEKGP